MRDLFPGWTPPVEATLVRYWEEATFAVDTSVLLDLYRFSHEARSGLLEALRSFGERLWVPHQVAYEFHRNRLGVLLDQREAEGALLGELDQIRKEIDDQLSKRLRGAGRRDLAPLREAIDGGFSRLREKLEEAEQAHTEGLGGSIQDDPIYDEVVALCGGRVGEGFDADRMKAVCADAEERLKRKMPPGYLDADKEGDDRFGDVIVWHQLCDKAQETERPVVLIADDQKADWIWEVRGKTLGPRPELVAEMKERAGVGFHIYTPARLLQVWEERGEGREVEEGVLDEIERPVKFTLDPSVSAALRAAWAKEASSTVASRISAWLRDSRATASHRFVENGVELRLAFTVDPMHSPPAGYSVKVTDPLGYAVTREVHAVSFLPAAYLIEVRYPDDFDLTSGLLPGRYQVEWFAGGVDEDRLGQYTFVVDENS